MIIILDYLNEHKIYIVIIMILLFVVLYLYLNPKIIIKKEVLEKEIIKENKKGIRVEIKGAVLNPGVYEMEEDSRIIDLINKSGGTLDDANLDYLNLSTILKDEMVVKVFTNRELEEHKKVEIVYEYIPLECECPKDEIINDSKININKASKEELMSLTGFGETKALSVIEYRIKNGEFKSIDDIMNVSGIGETLFNKIKEDITI